jgi:hypothetical protein
MYLLKSKKEKYPIAVLSFSNDIAIPIRGKYIKLYFDLKRPGNRHHIRMQMKNLIMDIEKRML